MSHPITIFWFRRDLRLSDNRGLFEALKASKRVLPLFIFDSDILKPLPKNDHRVSFIFDAVVAMKHKMAKEDKGLLLQHGSALDIFSSLLKKYEVNAVYCNADHEPHGQERDEKIRELLAAHAVSFHSFLDHLVFDKDDVLKADGTPYKVFTPYSQQWKSRLTAQHTRHYPSEDLLHHLVPGNFPDQGSPDLPEGFPQQDNVGDVDSTSLLSPELKNYGFERSDLAPPDLHIDESLIRNYDKSRDYPAQEGTSRLGVHLRFGTISIRDLVKKASQWNDIFLNELIWREFYAMILWHFPFVVGGSFKPEYDRILWRNDEKEFERWTSGTTGYPMVDAGMRQLNTSGYMHNRLRMVTASFLTKHLLIDWRWGEAYFAQKLFDYELSSNNGGWQWAAGTGCDAAPYFRIFNPAEQLKKFDPQREFVKRWIPELDTGKYPEPLVDHKKARERCLRVYKDALKG